MLQMGKKLGFFSEFDTEALLGFLGFNLVVYLALLFSSVVQDNVKFYEIDTKFFMNLTLNLPLNLNKIEFVKSFCTPSSES